MERQITGYPSIDKPWLKYYQCKDAIRIEGKTVYEVLYERNQDHPAETALEYFGRKITYRELFRRIERVKAAFERAGVKKGDQVAFLASSTPEIVYGILALCRIGAIANMVNPLFESEQIHDRIGETHAEIIVVLDQLYPKLKSAVEQCGTLTDIRKIIVVPVANSMPWGIRQLATLKMKVGIPYDRTTVSWVEFINGKGSGGLFTSPDAKYERERAFIMVYSSGSTGAAKGIVLTNGGICATISHYLSPNFPYERGDRYLQMIPVWFSTGIVLSVVMPLCLGITVILEPVFSKESFAKDIARYRPNMTLTATSLWLYAMRSRELKNKDLSFLKYPITGGELILERVEASINQFLAEHGCKAPLIKGYGMCELGSTISTDDLKHQKPGAAGFPISEVTVAAFDIETNEEQSYGKPGELRVLSPAHMKGYFNNPRATDEFFWRDEEGRAWGRTGDMGYVDEDGFIHVLGRMSDYFIPKSGIRRYCFDIENVILEDPAVAQCEVVGILEDGAEVPVAHLVLEDGAVTDVRGFLKRIHTLCVDRLNTECVPQRYRIWEAFPVKNNGKRDMEKIKEITDGFMVPPFDGASLG